MKNKYLRKIISACLISSTVIAAMPITAHAAWISDYYGGWAYSDGYNLATGWKYINGFWYYFDSMGRMQTGWISDGGKWYYLNSNGEMQTGVIQIEGKIYLFAQNGEMQMGFAVVDGKQYNFADQGACIGDDMPVPKMAYDYYGVSTVPFTPNQIMNSNTQVSNEIPSDGSEVTVKFKVTYKDDDGKTLSVRSMNADDKITLYEPSKNGYTFIEWNTKKNGTGTSYNAEDKLKLTKDITLYAQWDEIEEKDDKDEDEVLVTGIKIRVAGAEDTSVPTIPNNSKVQLSRTITPSNATNTKVTWSVKTTSTGGKATIDNKGILTTTKAGYITVVARAQDGSDSFGEKKLLIED